MPSLTSPTDCNGVLQLDTRAPPLTDAETDAAMKEQFSAALVDAYPAVDRRYEDPVMIDQRFCLHSFVPAVGAVPDKHGLFGFIKCRGNFARDDDARCHAESLIRKVDSYAGIFESRVGHPFPIFDTRKAVPAPVRSTAAYAVAGTGTVEKPVMSRLGLLVDAVDEIDMSRSVAAALHEDVVQKRNADEQKMREIKEAERMLLEDAANPNPLDAYVTLRVKRANLAHTRTRVLAQLKLVTESIGRTSQQIAEMDAQDAAYASTYYERLREGRERAGLSMDDEVMAFLDFAGENDEHNVVNE